MDIDPTVTRRALLAAGAAGAGAVALAACGSSGGGGEHSSDTQPAQGGGDSPGSNSAGGSGGSGGSGADALATLAQIPVGQAVSVTLNGGQPGIVARPTASTAVAFSAICTHMGCTVKPKGAKLVCPCHGSQYNALTGAVLNGPAPAPLHKVPVTVSGGKVVAS